MNIIITGGLGFIGSYVVGEHLHDENEVYVIDNFSTGHVKNLRDPYAPNLHIYPTMKYIDTVPKAELIFHLGCPSSSPLYKADPFLVASAVKDWMEILEYAKKHGSRIVYASSSSLYNGNDPPFHEAMPILVTDYYTEARYAMERLATLYHRLHGVDSIGLRFFSVYGPRETYKKQYANCLTQFLWGMLKNERPVIFGDGKQTRDLIHVYDVMKMIRLAAYSDIPFGIFNVGTGKSYSFNTLIRRLNRELGTSIKPEYVENPINNYVQDTKANMRITKEVFDFKPEWDLERGIENIANFYKHNL